MADVHAVDGNAPTVGLIEAGQEAAQGRLARAGRADKGHGFTGGNGQIDILHHLALTLIAKGDVLVVDVAFQCLYINRRGRIDNIGGRSQQFEIALKAGNAVGIAFNHAVDLLDGTEEEIR